MAKETEDTRASFLVKEKSFLGHAIHEEGATFYIDPETHPADSFISDNLSPSNAIAQKMVDDQKEPHPDKSAGKKVKAAPKAAPAAEAPAPEAEELADADLG
jgi:hypothetical protein